MNAFLSSIGLATVQSGLSRAKSALDRVLLWPVCLHPEIMRECPPGDVANARKTGIALYLTAIYLGVVFTNASRVMLSPTGELRFGDIVLGVIVAAIVTLVDINVFVAGSHFTHGLAEVARTGQFKLLLTRSARAMGGALLAIRIAIAVTTANFIGVTATTEAFNKEIAVQITREHTRQNASIIKAAADRLEGENRSNDRGQGALRSSITELDEEARRLRALMVDPGVSDPNHRATVEAVARAQAAKAEAESALLDARTLSADELGGTCRPGRSCRPGRGPKWLAAQERIDAAAARLRSADSTLSAAEKWLAASDAGYTAEKQRKIEATRARLGEVTALREAQARQLARLADEHRTRFADRERSLQEAVRTDPNFVPREEGLLARLKALRELMNEPAAATMTYLLGALLVLIELAAVLSVMVSFVPMTYATKLVERDLKRAYETARRLAGLAGSTTPDPTTPDAPATAAAPEPPKSGNDGALTSDDPIAAGSSRRHAPRWRPPVRSSGDEGLSGDGSAAPSGMPSPSPA